MLRSTCRASRTWNDPDIGKISSKTEGVPVEEIRTGVVDCRSAMPFLLVYRSIPPYTSLNVMPALSVRAVLLVTIASWPRPLASKLTWARVRCWILDTDPHFPQAAPAPFFYSLFPTHLPTCLP